MFETPSNNIQFSQIVIPLSFISTIHRSLIEILLLLTEARISFYDTYYLQYILKAIITPTN